MLWIVALSVFASCTLCACFDRDCGRSQVLRETVCVCKGGLQFDARRQCRAADAGSSGSLDGSAGRDASSDASDGLDASALDAGGCDAETGLGCLCSSDGDCAGFAADYCVPADPGDPLARRVCLLQGCEASVKQCPKGLQCCAFPFAPEGSVCLAESAKCPFE